MCVCVREREQLLNWEEIAPLSSADFLNVTAAIESKQIKVLCRHLVLPSFLF